MVLHVSSQPNMATETLQMSRLANGEAESSHHRKSDQTPHQALNGRRFGNLGSEGASARPCSDENGREVTDVIRKKAKRQKGMTFQDMYSNQGLFDEEDDDDSDWEPPQVQRTSQMALQRKAKQQKEMTFQDMYNNQGLFDEDDDDDDGDWESAQEQHTSQMALQNKAKQQKEMTFQDMYNNQGLFDEDDDDDGDWEPAQEHVETVKWFCTNCTMVNLDDVTHCDICGEHKESGILRHGFFASPFSHDVGRPVEVEHEIKGHKDLGSQIPTSNSSTAVGFDERMLLHSEVEMKPHPHPERPDRLRAIAASLATAGIFPGRCYPISAREITKEELQRVHSVEHIETVELTSHILSSYFTPDTYANEHSARAARLAAGLCADLATEIFSGRAKNGFALVRPPGHHAGVRQAMGFCLHNNAAVAALAAQVAGAKKVLIVDWDVHHGNGTQEIFDRNKSVLYISLHRHEGGKFYPGTGAALEVGTMGAEGYCVNIPWSCGGVGDNDYIFAFQHIVLPIASEFAPDFTIISAGFDAARGDPLGCCDVTPAGYALMTHMLYALSSGKLLVILEGGYNLRSISSSATAVIKVLLGESPGCNLDNVLPSKAGALTVLEVLKIQMNFWPTLGSRFSDLQAQWGMYSLKNKKNRIKKRRRAVAPLWWKWGQKSLLYHLLNRHLHIKSKRC